MQGLVCFGNMIEDVSFCPEGGVKLLLVIIFK